MRLPAWGRADAHIWLGQVYAKQKRRDAALWSPVALGFAVALALTEHLPWPEALTAGTMSTLPGALLGLGQFDVERQR